jgi:hypothetical protein
VVCLIGGWTSRMFSENKKSLPVRQALFWILAL